MNVCIILEDSSSSMVTACVVSSEMVVSNVSELPNVDNVDKSTNVSSFERSVLKSCTAIEDKTDAKRSSDDGMLVVSEASSVKLNVIDGLYEMSTFVVTTVSVRSSVFDSWSKDTSGKPAVSRLCTTGAPSNELIEVPRRSVPATEYLLRGRDKITEDATSLAEMLKRSVVKLGALTIVGKDSSLVGSGGAMLVVRSSLVVNGAAWSRDVTLGRSSELGEKFSGLGSTIMSEVAHNSSDGLLAVG